MIVLWPNVEWTRSQFFNVWHDTNISRSTWLPRNTRHLSFLILLIIGILQKISQEPIISSSFPLASTIFRGVFNLNTWILLSLAIASPMIETPAPVSKKEGLASSIPKICGIRDFSLTMAVSLFNTFYFWGKICLI